MARVFLHIGAHKTGTSYLQHLFYLNRARLAQAGIHYPVIGPNDAHHALAAAWIDMPDLPAGFFGKDGPDKLWNDLVARYARAPGTVFLSAENLSRRAPEQVDFNDLARRLSAFDEVRVIYTMRRQAELVQSLWLQAAKSGRVLALRPYLARAFDEGLGGGIGIDHEALYESLLEGFRPDQIILFDYEHIRHAEGGIAQVFLDLVGAGLNAADLSAPPESRANISPDPLAFYLAGEIAGRTMPPQDLVEAVAGILRTDPPRRRSLLNLGEYKRFHRLYAPGNARLTERVQRWQPGFAFADPEPSDEIFYRNNVAEWQWLQIAAMLYRDPPRATATERARWSLLRMRGRQ